MANILQVTEVAPDAAGTTDAADGGGGGGGAVGREQTTTPRLCVVFVPTPVAAEDEGKARSGSRCASGHRARSGRRPLTGSAERRSRETPQLGQEGYRKPARENGGDDPKEAPRHLSDGAVPPGGG